MLMAQGKLQECTRANKVCYIYVASLKGGLLKGLGTKVSNTYQGSHH